VKYDPPAAAIVDDSFAALPYVYTHATTGDELLVVARSRMESALREDLLGSGFSLTHAGDQEEPPESARRAAEPGRLWLLTSGSTGRPKRIGHTLETLTTVTGEQDPRRWLCPYSPGTYAWWQVVTLSLSSPAQDLVVVDPADLETWPSVARQHEVTAASGTPTFWRQTIMRSGEELSRVPLKQISLGGEPVDQAVLDQLRGLFPDARISWIYASSEVGASIVVHDGQAGFPVEWLDQIRPGRPTISVVDDELVIASPHHGLGLEGAVRTGDRVVVADGRVQITGRLDTDEINVGGAKMSAGVVRSVLQAHPSVLWAKVTGRKAPVVGRVVVADVVAAPGSGEDDAELTGMLTAWCRERLPEYGVPRRFRFLDAIPSKETLKSDV
jgi:acyl-coenzyme A synthetase/AMP-(fatty) acid ligase